MKEARSPVIPSDCKSSITIVHQTYNYPWRKTRAMSLRASKSVQRCRQDAVRRIQKKQRVEPKTVAYWVSAPPTPLFRSAPYFACWVAPWTCFLSLSFRTIGQEMSELWGVEVRHFPLTRLIAYTTACCYRTNRDRPNGANSMMC